MANALLKKSAVAAGIPLALYLLVTLAVPRPAEITPESWRLLGIFAATIVALMLRPLPGGAVVLLAIICAALFGGVPLPRALSAFADPVVWLVLAAFMISCAMIGSGLARRIALLFVRAFGKTSLGVCYALAATDMVLAGIIPSNGARSGGVVLPIVRSVAELYDSRPGETASRIGSFLMLGVYQSICVTAAMFLTGQASNPLAARLASTQYHFNMTWTSWLVAGSVPGLLSLAIVPWVVYRLYPPQIRRTPEASQFAARELAAMGPISRAQKIVLAVFALVCGLWIFSPLDVTLSALIGAAALLATGVLKWEEVISDRAAWDIFIWYGGLLMLAKSLNDAGLTRAFATSVASALGLSSWLLLLAIAAAIYFYSHYAFASITAHLLALFGAFSAVVIARGAPVGLAVYLLVTFGNLSSCLTNYGTTPAPMFFAQGYVPFGAWWKIGFVISLIHLILWSTVGAGWWKLLGIW